MKAPLPTNEIKRLENLHSYQILDTLDEQIWDDLALLAAYICQTPIAAISFVDQERQWFKAITGLEAKETSREVAFCAYAILQKEPLIINNATEDPRFQDNLLVINEPLIRFYAGAQIESKEGFSLGSICVIDRIPRNLSQEQITALKTLSRQVTALLDLHAQNHHLQLGKQNAEALSQTKSHFIADMSHELRTPLNAIIGFSELLLEDAPQAFEPIQTREDLEKILNAGRHLLGLVNDILDLSKIEAGKMRVFLENTDLHNFILRIYAALSPLAKKNNNQFTLDQIEDLVTKEIQTDQQKLRQILYNLLSNAFKFTKNGTVSLTVTIETKGVYFKIQDTGIGIGPEDQLKLFEIFEQANSSIAPKYGGTGLGLALSQKFANMLDGKISVESEIGKGSLFTLYLPFKTEADTITLD
jgi:two-component system, sensor histidine kinase